MKFEAIRARAPLRLGLAGGGTDLSPYCDQYGGAVLNLTIDRYAYATILPRDDHKIVFEAHDLDSYKEYSIHDDFDKKSLMLHCGVYERMIALINGGRRLPMTLITNVDAPMGSGLGSSSALAVALVDAFAELFDAPLSEYEVARLAYEIERLDLGLAGGRQDQYAAAFGGINYIEFLPNDHVIVNPLRLQRRVRNELEASLLVCFTGQSRESAGIIKAQTTQLDSGNARTFDAMHQLKADSVTMKQYLLKGDIRNLAAVLSHSWEVKKATATGISNPQIEKLYEVAMSNGALGGKVSGAGGGGFMFFIVPPEKRFRLVDKLRNEGAAAEPIALSDRGVEAWRPVAGG